MEKTAADNNKQKPEKRLSRRKFLLTGAALGGGLLVGLHVATRRDLLGDPSVFPAHDGEVALNAWLKIATDGTVTVAVPRSEMGQGVYTSLPMLVADELGAEWGSVRFEQSPIERVYGNVKTMADGLPLDPLDEGTFANFARWAAKRMGAGLGLQLTGGSSSIQDAWEPMRTAGAVAREMLIAAAAKRWGVEATDCEARNGQVVHNASGRVAGFGELASDAASAGPPSAWPELKDPSTSTLIGKPLPRLDIPAKVDGSAQFGIDVTQPDMLHATVKVSPVFGGTVKSLDHETAKTMPGVYKIVGIANGVAVIADSYWRAKKAMDAVSIDFDEGTQALSSQDIKRQLTADLDSQDGHAFDERGDVESALEGAAIRLEAQYEVPYLAHACMEPINCTARIADGVCDVWAPNQAPSVLRSVAAEVAGVPKEKVRVHTTLLGGGFGRRFEMDAIVQAVSIANHTDGRPVRVVWSREEDIQHDVYRPAALGRFQGGLDGSGKARVFHARLVSQSVTAGVAERNLGLKPGLPDKATAEGVAHLAYEIPTRRVEHVVSELPVPVGFWRSVGHSHNAFFSECFIDEMAHAAKADPVAFRRGLLSRHPRHRAALDLLVEKAGWEHPTAAGVGRGVALHRSFGSIVGQVAELRVVRGKPKLDRVVCVLDCGQVVNPDTVVAQMESGIVFGLSATLFGEITLKDGRVQQSNFPDYPVVKLADMPRIETHIIESREPPGGVGEPGTPPIAPAVANAVFHLTGQRLRRLPLRLDTSRG